MGSKKRRGGQEKGAGGGKKCVPTTLGCHYGLVGRNVCALAPGGLQSKCHPGQRHDAGRLAKQRSRNFSFVGRVNVLFQHVTKSSLVKKTLPSSRVTTCGCSNNVCPSPGNFSIIFRDPYFRNVRQFQGDQFWCGINPWSCGNELVSRFQRRDSPNPTH